MTFNRILKNNTDRQEQIKLIMEWFLVTEIMTFLEFKKYYI